MSDLIDRQAAISAICNACGKIDCDKMDKCEKLQLPPANSSEFPNNSDTISRQAAISAICNACGKIDCDKMDKCEKLQLPPANSSEFPNNSDTISRQAAIDALKGLPTWWADAGGYYGGAQPPMVALLDPEDAVSAIENLPSAQPERKKGKWDFMGWQMFQCSECKHMFTQDFLEGWKEYTYESHFPPFCPNCGADMRGEQDE